MKEEVAYAAAAEHTLTIEDSLNAVISPVGKMSVKEGFPVEISAVASSGYAFLKWEKTSGSGSVVFNSDSSSSTTVLVSNGDATIAATIRVIGDPYNESIEINSGDAYTNNNTVTLALSAEDDNAVTEMRISENSTYANNNWIPYATSYTYDLSAGDGTKTVYAWFKNASDKVSASAGDSIILDTSSPSIFNKTPSPSATGVAVSSTVTVVFDQPVDPSTLTSSTFYLKKGASPVSTAISYVSGSNTAILTPLSDLDWSATYTAYITTGVTDYAGNTLGSGSNWSFTIKDKEASLTLKDSVYASSITYNSTTGSGFRYMALSGGYIYATADSNQSWGIMGKISVSDPSNMAVVVANDLSTGSQMIVSMGSYIYVTHDSGRVYRMDTSLNEGVYGPADTTYYGEFLNVNGNGNSLIQVNYSYLNSYSSSLSYGHELYSGYGDFPGDPGDTQAMITNGDWTYLGETYYDMSNTNSIEVIYTGQVGSQGATYVSKLLDITSYTGDYDEVTDMASDSGELLYVTHQGNNTTGIVVIDTNDPSDPYSIVVFTSATANLNSITGTQGIAIGDYTPGETYAVVTRGSYGLALLDLTNFYSPQVLISSKTIGTNAYRVLFDGHYAYVFVGSSKTSMTRLDIYELSIF